jgi:hypothetical protein
VKDKELEDIAWRLIAEAKAEGNLNRRHRLMQEAFELVRCASALREINAERDTNAHPTPWSAAPTKSRLERSEAFRWEYQ